MARRSQALVLVCLLGVGCRDREAERFARAKLRYEALVTQQARADAPGFAEVQAELEAVPAASPHFGEAQRLAEALRRARGPHVRTPLALAPRAGARPAELEAALRACARLAELAGADGGVDRRALEALEACRHRAEVLELRLSHGEDALDGGDPH